MPHGTKIATCCYCGTRAALVLSGDTRHELACAACGAPLHDLKMLKSEAVRDHPVTRTAPAGPARPSRPGPALFGSATPRTIWEREAQGRKFRGKKRKKRKSLAKRFLEEAFDAIEDIFD